jgi:hypothetical protein
MTEVAASIDATEARQRGFGTGLDRLERDFSSDLGWTIRAEPVRPADEQYLSRTTLEGTIRLKDLVLVASPLADCEPRLAVGVDISLHTGDGALIATGSLGGTLTRFGRQEVGGIFDLSAVHATLSAIPGLPSPRMVSEALVSMQLWPDSVRGLIQVTLPEPGAQPVDGGIRGELLEGIFPIDDCPSDSAPLEPAAASPALAGLSPNQVNERLNTVLRQRMPMMARWQDGRETTVTFGAGSPLRHVCVREVDAATGSGFFFYDAQLVIKSADGRVNIEQGGAHSYVQISKDGAIEKASLEIYPQDHAISQQELPKVAGISGLDLGGAQYFFWSAELQLQDTGQELACRGSVGLDGSNIPNVLDPIAKLTWGPQPGFP